MKSTIITLLLLLIVESSYATPNHLTPIAAYNYDGYEQAVYKSLIGNKTSGIWMVVLPSFSVEYAVVLYENVEYKIKNGEIVIPPEIIKTEWLLEKVEVKQKVSNWKDVGDDKYILKIQPTNNITRKSISVKEVDFKYIIKAWKTVLQKTRYPEDDTHVLLDGVIYQFYSHFNMFGETHSPKTGIPLKLVELGRMLEKIVYADKDRRVELMVKANKVSKEIINEMNGKE